MTTMRPLAAARDAAAREKPSQTMKLRARSMRGRGWAAPRAVSQQSRVSVLSACPRSRFFCTAETNAVPRQRLEQRWR